MSVRNNNPLSLGQIEADLFMAKSAMDQATTMSSKRGKFLEARRDTTFSRQLKK